MNNGTTKRGKNALTNLEYYTLSDMVDTVGLLGRQRISTVLDMASGYLQVGIEERDREKNSI